MHTNPYLKKSTTKTCNSSPRHAALRSTFTLFTFIAPRHCARRSLTTQRVHQYSHTSAALPHHIHSYHTYTIYNFPRHRPNEGRCRRSVSTAHICQSRPRRCPARTSLRLPRVSLYTAHVLQLTTSLFNIIIPYRADVHIPFALVMPPARRHFLDCLIHFLLRTQCGLDALVSPFFHASDFTTRTCHSSQLSSLTSLFPIVLTNVSLLRL
jgi:hypothetical protein